LNIEIQPSTVEQETTQSSVLLYNNYSITTNTNIKINH